MTTKKLVPRASGEGAMGVDDNAWGEAYYDTGNFNKGLFVSGHNITQVIAETVTQGGLGGEWTRNGLDIYYNGGNVGIGTTSPGAKLHIAGGPTNLGGILLGHQSGTGIDSFRFYIDSENKAHITRGTSEKITILNTGNVGIGTTSPGAKLEVFQDLDTSSGASILKVTNTRVDTGSSSSVISLITDEVDGGTADERVQLAGSYDGTNGGKLDILTNNGLSLSPAVTIKHNGNVGIGVANPAHTIPVGHATKPMFGLGNSLSASISLLRNDASIVSGNAIGGMFFYGNGSTDGINPVSPKELASIECIASENHLDGSHKSKLSFGTNSGSELNRRMVIESDGNVGIGTPDPSSTLTVSRLDQNETNAALSVYRSDTSPDHRPTAPIFNLFNGTGGSSEVFRVQGNGNVGIGTTTPSEKLEVRGHLRFGPTAYGSVREGSIMNLPQNGFYDLLLHNAFQGFLIVSITSTGNANIRTYATYSVFGRGSDFSFTLITSENGAVGGVAFALSRNSTTGAIRLSNASNLTCQSTMVFYGSTSF